jgi:hypothetical protein
VHGELTSVRCLGGDEVLDNDINHVSIFLTEMWEKNSQNRTPRFLL